MKKVLSVVLSLITFCALTSVVRAEQNAMRIFDEVIFYDGYLLDKNPDKDLDDGVLRHSCSLYAKRLTDEQLDALGTTLELNARVQACCDNYDRIGNVNIAFVEKGAETYIPEETSRIEIGRFITPFMDMNKEPNEVPYTYNIDYLSPILRDKDLREKYDIWMEYEIFGVPYSANTQIQGCENRSDVFAGILELVTGEPAGESEGNTIVPIVIKKPEYIGGNLNNYNENATDELGKTVKTYSFEVPEETQSSQIVVITSNHGANENGEEYNRRWHFVYFDDELVLSYRPGRESCEPFRQYNTQSNGIYGYSKKSDEVWQSFSNWCPGDVIDNRIIDLGNVSKGEHKIRIEVPLAEFVGQQGDIPVSIYFMGNNDTENPDGVFMIYKDNDCPVKFSVDGGVISVDTTESIFCIEIYSLSGERIYRQEYNSPIDLRGNKGVFLICVELENGKVFSSKVCL